MDNRGALLILNAIKGLTSRRIQDLIKYFGSAQAVLSSVGKIREHKFLPEQAIQHIESFPQESFFLNEEKLIAAHKADVITLWDKDYPKTLKEISNPPVVLYVKGTLNKDEEPALAIVGSRQASIYGMTMAEKFALELAELGITIVSGLAKGIDTFAHRGALKAKGRTIAVLGSGLANLYPRDNKKLFEEIAENGAVISEFPMTTEPLSYNFPQRNRIISGLSLGVLIVEAALKSGALITSDFALEQGKEVFALPGKIDSPNSKGVHQLIKQGAKLSTHRDDILEELKVPLKKSLVIEFQTAQVENFELNSEENEIFQQIKIQPLHIEDLAGFEKQPINRLSSVLLNLELKGLIKQLPGKNFVRCK
ncbi:MAG: DNA protecting protein DprA [Omnitrophica WOR_2 bacterium GWA2_47_8]|nr:MAG: DNA protecting protein DprA [Omnitrophica WOR_2 bacterium GWA2_47_8]